jgi:hypothetical protein
MFVMIAIIGMLATFLNSGFEIGSFFQDFETIDLESLLDYLNLGLAFLAFTAILIFVFIRAAKGIEGNWLEQVLRNIEEEDQIED